MFPWAYPANVHREDRQGNVNNPGRQYPINATGAAPYIPTSGVYFPLVQQGVSGGLSNQHELSTLTSARQQVFDYDQASLKEQIRANILQQISQYQGIQQQTLMPILHRSTTSSPQFSDPNTRFSFRREDHVGSHNSASSSATPSPQFSYPNRPSTFGPNKHLGSYNSGTCSTLPSSRFSNPNRPSTSGMKERTGCCDSVVNPPASTYTPNSNLPGSSHNVARDKQDSYARGRRSEETSATSFKNSPAINSELNHSRSEVTQFSNSPSMQVLNDYQSASSCSHSMSPMLENRDNPVSDEGRVFSQKTRGNAKRPFRGTAELDVGGKKKRMSFEKDGKKNLSGKKNHFQQQQQQRTKSAALSNVYNTDGYHDNAAPNFIPIHQLPIRNKRGMSPKDPCEQISKAIVNYFLENQQTNAVYTMKMQLRDALSSVIESVFPCSGLYIVGSSMSGFGTKKSDMDLCLMITQENVVEKKEATDLLYALQKSLRMGSFVKNLEVIRARVPILRFRDKVSDVECDLNVNNLVGIRNTHLLKHYALMDWRVRPLGLFIKYWARSQNINDARNMTISSYSFALMLIHYLQCGCTPPVLPSLQVQFPREFSATSDVCTLQSVPLNHHSPNNLSVGELFLGFLEYYTFTFDYKRDAISVRQGKILPIHLMKKHTKQEARQWSCLCIEEPFERSNTARSVFDENTFKRIQKVFRGSFLRLNKTKDTKTITAHKL